MQFIKTLHGIATTNWKFFCEAVLGELLATCESLSALHTAELQAAVANSSSSGILQFSAAMEKFVNDFAFFTR